MSKGFYHCLQVLVFSLEFYSNSLRHGLGNFPIKFDRFMFVGESGKRVVYSYGAWSPGMFSSVRFPQIIEHAQKLLFLVFRCVVDKRGDIGEQSFQTTCETGLLGLLVRLACHVSCKSDITVQLPRQGCNSKLLLKRTQ